MNQRIHRFGAFTCSFDPMAGLGLAGTELREGPAAAERARVLPEEGPLRSESSAPRSGEAGTSSRLGG